MSVENIIDKEYDSETGELVVTFQSRSGEQRTYTYSGAAAIGIMSGDDPRRYPADQGDHAHANVISSVQQEVEAGEEAGAGAGAVEEAAEIITGLL